MSIPTDFNPLGLTMQLGMWIDNGVLKGRIFNILDNNLITSVDPCSDTSGITNGSYMFQKCKGIIAWSNALPNLTNGTYMFSECSNLKEWKTDLPILTYGNYMFHKCEALTDWSIDLPYLVDGTYMFCYCSSMTSFSGDLSKLKNGFWMFRGNGLIDWNVELPSLQSADRMFIQCKRMKRWNINLPQLRETSHMFYQSGLTSFLGKLPNLSSGQNMFYDCNLDEESVLYILRGNGLGTDYEGIPTYTSGSHLLHLGKSTNFKESEEIASLLNTTTPIAPATNYSYKGWTITITN